MPFKKGKSGNPKGKPKGTQNKATAQIRGMIESFLMDNFQTIVRDFNQLSPKDKAKLYCDLLQYGLPRLQAVSEIPFERMTDDQLDEIISKLKAI